jgi:arylsulfatase A-like enzyme
MKSSTQDWPQRLKAPDGAPNVLLILGDDIGFGTPSAFGGPVNTPVFDRIAKEGLRYSDFHTTAVCAASRAALLTGRNAHSVGFGFIPDGAVGFPGYNCMIPPSAASVLEILRMNGYGTAWIGKADNTPVDAPHLEHAYSGRLDPNGEGRARVAPAAAVIFPLRRYG